MEKRVDDRELSASLSRYHICFDVRDWSRLDRNGRDELMIRVNYELTVCVHPEPEGMIDGRVRLAVEFPAAIPRRGAAFFHHGEQKP